MRDAVCPWFDSKWRFLGHLKWKVMKKLWNIVERLFSLDNMTASLQRNVQFWGFGFVDQNLELPKGLFTPHLIEVFDGSDEGVYSQVSATLRDYWNMWVFMAWLERENQCSPTRTLSAVCLMFVMFNDCQDKPETCWTFSQNWFKKNLSDIWKNFKSLNRLHLDV